MNKKLLAVAVAGAFTAAPLAALAQSSVTISGFFKGSFDHHSIQNAFTGPTVAAIGQSARTGNKSENRVTDHSSRMLFNVVEDLGGGMQAIAQYDLRFQIDGAQRFNAVGPSGSIGTSPSPNPVSSGNSHVGIRSNTWGSIRIGRQDTHYGNSGDNIAVKGALWLHNSSLFDTVMRPGSTGNGIANLSRTANLVWYDSPKWGGFTFMVGYSTSGSIASGAQTGENDLGTSNRKGRAWTFNPVYNGGNWEVAWSHWDSKSDWAGGTTSIATFTEATANGINDEKADSVRGHYKWGGLQVGLGWNHSKVMNPFAGNAVGDRRAWAIPISYTMGPHTFSGTYTKAGDSKDVGAAAAVTQNGVVVYAGTAGTAGANTGAHLLALNYSYDLSKRTAVSLSYGKVVNRSAGRYGFFYVSENVMGGTNTGLQPGESSSMWGVVLRHAF